MLTWSSRRHNIFLRLHILDAACFCDFPGVLIDSWCKCILTFLLSSDCFLFSHFLSVHELHLLGIGFVKVIQIKLLTWSMHLFPGQLFLFSGFPLLKFSLSFKLGDLHFLIPIFDLFLVSCTGKDRSLLLDHLLASLVNFWLERRLRCLSV